MKASGRNRRFAIAGRRASIDGCPSTLTAFGSATDDTRPAWPIVARCALSRPDGGQAPVHRAPPAGPRSPCGLDSRAMRTTLESGSGRPVGGLVRRCVFEPADACKTR
ncbi:hypothetical protein CFB52_020895 [Burkholderia sp. AU18528]|nr:hypothetical protein CFB52_020895 [Burkholderia sp. AU18528]RQX84704.1 hypothetical protein DF034_01345 [Burkholderia anthina]